MGFKALSTTRSGAASIVSRQSVIVNTVDGFAVSGATISGNTSINIEVTTPGQGTSITPVSGGGLTITGVNYLYANGVVSPANAVSTSGGNIKINGTSFTDPMTVIVGGTQLSNSNVTVANSSAIIATLGSASPGNASIFTFNASNAGAQLANAVHYSGIPEWTTSSISLVNNSESNVALVASSDSTLTYTLQDGSSLPTGMSLISTGYIAGTPTGYSDTTVLTPVIVATDAEGQATQQTITITITTADPYFSYVTLLLNGATGTNLVNNATNNTFLDSSTNNFTVTRVGTTTQGSYSPFPLSGAYSTTNNGGSAYLDGSGNYLSLATNSAFNITSGSTDSFICEFFVNWSTVAANMSIVDNGGLNNVSFANWSVTLNASSQITLNWGNSAAPGSTIGVLATSIVPTAGQWYHIAFVKTNADWALFVNGTRATSFSGLNTAGKSNSTALYIGYGIATSAAGNAFKGYISNLRIYKGATAGAPYAATSTTITVPTSPVTAITNTSLLTNFTNASIVDAHSSTNLQTVADAKSSTVVTKFGTTSVYFDGNGDYLNTQQLASSNYNLVTGDFTVEAWIYNAGAGAERYLFSQRGSGSGWEWRINSNNVLQFFFTGGSSLSTTGTISANTWTHVAVTRSGNTVRIFINGNQDASTNFSNGTSAAASYPLYIGYSTSGGSGYFLGYMDNIRITKGFARYTANFPVPTSGFLGQ